MANSAEQGDLARRLLSLSRTRSHGEREEPKHDGSTAIGVPVEADAEGPGATPPPRPNSAHQDSESLVFDDTMASDVSMYASVRAPSAGDLRLTERYENLGELGRGGMGQVLRVRDRLLNRVVAMKIVHGHLSTSEGSLERFVQEAQVCAQLQHPNILAIHDLGLLDSGQLFITMSEVKGASLHEHIQQVHEVSDGGQWGDGDDGWTLHRLVSIFTDVCKAVAYAHEHGVLHRDLKPKNIMVGPFGEVQIVDWGLAKVVGTKDLTSNIETARSQGESTQTVVGTIYGTPAYIAPEIAAQDISEANEKTEQYALGAILYEILRGAPAYSGKTPMGILIKIATTSPASFLESSRGGYAPPTDAQRAQPVSLRGCPIPESLVEICKRAIAREPEHRYDGVKEMVEALTGSLDGTEKRDRALMIVGEAEGQREAFLEAEAAAIPLARSAADALEGIPIWAPARDKVEAWRQEEEVLRLRSDALVGRTRQAQMLRAALAHKGDLSEAHGGLARHYLARHREAERIGDDNGRREAEIILEEHVHALPDYDETRQECLEYLDGSGFLDLQTRPSGAEMGLARLEIVDRLLVKGVSTGLGKSPLTDHRLAMGSYVITARLDGYHDLLYPVFNARLDNTGGVDPDNVIVPIELLRLGVLGPEDKYVPAGWCLLGGDRYTPNSLPRMRVWIEGFVIRQFPVTHQEYLEFLNTLVDRGETEAASNHAPREQTSASGDLGDLVYLLGEDGRYRLPEEGGETCRPRQPVTMIQWRSAVVYSEWLAAETGLPWRLPMEFEWEKAARGVDGRSYPWGEHLDPSWACMKDSHPGDILMQEVDSFPEDVSVYGVRGTAGNTRDWCLDRFREEGPLLDNSRLTMPSEDDLNDMGFKSSRGGSYGNSASRSRSGDRDWWFPERSYVGRGFRLAWGLVDRTPPVDPPETT